MPIPNFEEGGILPTGIHDSDRAEIGERFVHNAARKIVWDGCSSYLDRIQLIPEIETVYIDGSFVTDKEIPNDIDVVVELPDITTLWVVSAKHSDLFSRDYVKGTFKIDVLTTLNPIPAGVPDLREFFQYLRPQEVIDRGLAVGAKKGILRISVK